MQSWVYVSVKSKAPMFVSNLLPYIARLVGKVCLS